MLQPAKVATPLDGRVSGLVVQASVPDARGHGQRDRGGGVVTTLPPESSTLTTGWVVKVTPLVAVPEWW